MKTLTKFLTCSLLLLASAVHAQYCMLPGRTPYINIQPGISNFKLGTINRTSLPVESMSAVVVETNDTTVLLAGHTYTVTMTHTRDSINFPTVRNNIRVWIDYNGNFSYDDAGETVISADFQTYGVFKGTFTVPSTTPLGITHLRATAKMSSDGGHILPSSCDMPEDPIGYHGEMEDYVVRIAAPTAVSTVCAAEHNIVVYPNPTTNDVTISFDEISTSPISIDLFDITGKLVSNLLSEVQSSLSYHFDLNSYVASAGVYFIKINAQAGPSWFKIVKTN